MSAARSKPEVLESEPVEGPPMGLLFPDRVLRKSEWPVVANSLNDRMLEVTDAPTTYVLMSQVEEVIATAKKQLKPKVMLAAAGTHLNIGGAKVEYRKSAGKWDYRNDVKLLQLEAEIATLSELADARKKMLQALTEPVYDTELGSEVQPAVQSDPVYTVAVTFPKE